MQEFLVIFACLGNHGCTETSKTYYGYHPELREVVEYNERRVRNYLGPFIIDNVGPVVFMAAGGTGSFKLTENISLQISPLKDSMLIYNKGF